MERGEFLSMGQGLSKGGPEAWGWWGEEGLGFGARGTGHNDKWKFSPCSTGHRPLRVRCPKGRKDDQLTKLVQMEKMIFTPFEIFSNIFQLSLCLYVAAICKRIELESRGLSQTCHKKYYEI